MVYGVEAKRRVEYIDLNLLVNELQICIDSLYQKVVSLIIKLMVHRNHVLRPKVCNNMKDKNMLILKPLTV